MEISAVQFHSPSINFEQRIHEPTSQRRSGFIVFTVCSIVCHIILYIGVVKWSPTSIETVELVALQQPTLNFQLTTKTITPSEPNTNGSPSQVLTTNGSSDFKIASQTQFPIEQPSAPKPLKPAALKESKTETPIEPETEPEPISETSTEFESKTESEPVIEPEPKLESTTDQQQTEATAVTELPVLEELLPTVTQPIATETPAKTYSTEAMDTLLPTSPEEVALDPISTELQQVINGKISYPKLALKRGIEGDVMLAIQFDELGNLKTIDIAQSSGSSLLDKAALKATKSSLKKQTKSEFADQRITIIVEFNLTS